MKTETNKINEFPIDAELKSMIANMIRNKLEQMGIYMEENAVKVLEETFAEEIVTNVLESIVQWQNTKIS